MRNAFFLSQTSIANQAFCNAAPKPFGEEVVMFPQFLEIVDGDARSCWTYSTPSESCLSCRSIKCTGFPVLDHYYVQLTIAKSIKPSEIDVIMHYHIPCRPNVCLEFPPRELPQPLGEVLSVPLFLSRASDRYVPRSIQLFMIYITTFHVTLYLGHDRIRARIRFK